MDDNGPGGVRGEGAARSPEERLPLWLLRQKVAVPDRVAGCLDRAGLMERAMPTRRRLTVLNAPGGFGKTTLLAECCRQLRKEGVPVAWVSVDEQDDRAVLDTYIAYACRNAGALAEAGDLAIALLGSAGGLTESRTGLAMRGIEDLERPFVLAFDELEHLGNTDAAALLDFLLRRGPPNLHLAIACRELPAGLNIAGAVLEGRAAVLSADDLRFSSAEAADFFDGRLSPRELTDLMSESAGWPFALRIFRNGMNGGRDGGAHASREFVENWVESRLLAGLRAEDREFLLDIGLFDWMDAALLGDVLEQSDSMHRIDTMPALNGLLEPVRDAATDVWRLHPLIREHCVRRRFRETPERFRAIHRRLADSLMRRGQTVAAMRHAVEAGEPALAGDILERAGGVHLFTREGLVQFRAAERLLTGEAVGGRPRLALVGCLSSLLSGRLKEARETYRSMAETLDRLSADDSDAALALTADKCVVRGMIALYGGERFGSELIQAQLAEVERLAASPRVDPMTREFLEYSLCIAAVMTANFEAALDHAARARQCFADSPNISMFLDMQEGQVAMAQGRVDDAAALYRRAGQAAARRYVLDREPSAICEVLRQELALECANAAPAPGPPRIPEALTTSGTPFQAYAAASGAVVESTLMAEGTGTALAAAEEMLAYVRRAELPALVRFVSALKVSLLALAGRVADGERLWASEGLPEDAAGCLDLTGQTWREMEALSSARLRLDTGSGRFEEARAFAAALRGLAAERGLKRTLMRALALSAALEVRAGGDAAAGHVEAYLRLHAETPYAGPMARERADCADIVASLLESAPDPSSRKAAYALLLSMERSHDLRPPRLSKRQSEVLQRLGEQRDKQIAAELGLSPHGVRHHIRKLFAKLGVRSRAEAVHRAREMGLLPGDSRGSRHDGR